LLFDLWPLVSVLWPLTSRDLALDLAMITRDVIIVRTIVDLPQEQIRKLTLFCRKEKISRAEAVRRAVEQLLRGSSANDLRAYFGASKTRSVSRHLTRLRREWNRPA
jgi:hypothetical protein